MSSKNHFEVAKKVLLQEAKAIEASANKLDDKFNEIVDIICKSKGRVIISGMGKSGNVGVKIAATLSSVGTPSVFIHPADAYHGDLGVIQSEDIVILISNSGETEEITRLMSSIKEMGNTIIAMTGVKDSALGWFADYVIDIAVKEEACPLNLAPTTSTTLTLALGDALAVSVMKSNDFKEENFARLHPGGSLGRRLLKKVSNKLIREVPVISADLDLMQAICVINNHGLGLTVVSDGSKFGIITDGDIRHALYTHKDSGCLMGIKAGDITNYSPIVISSDRKMSEAKSLMTAHKVSSLLVVEDQAITPYGNLDGTVSGLIGIVKK